MAAGAFTTAPIGSCSRDPIGYVDGHQLFASVRNNSLTFADPTGLVVDTATVALEDDALAG